MQTATPEQLKRGYTWPPRATTSTPPNTWELFKKLNWIAQPKVNDTHALYDFDIEKSGYAKLICVWDRHKGLIKHDWTRLTEELENMANAMSEHTGHLGRYLFDGGLLHHKHASIKETVAIWDILIAGNSSMIGQTYTTRYQSLEKITKSVNYEHASFNIGYLISPHIFVPRNITHPLWNNTWNEIQEVNIPYKHPVIEGFMFKDMNSKLTPGIREINNNSWMARSRVTTGRHAF